MRKILLNIRQRPAHIKEQIAVFSAIALTAVIAFFWVTSLGSQLASQDAKESFASNLSPFKVLKDNLKAAVIDTQQSFKSATSGNQTTDQAEKGKDFVPVTIDQSGTVILGNNK